MRYHPLMGRMYSPEELHPSPNPAELARMYGCSSVEEMEKDCMMEEEPDLAHVLTDEDLEYAKWAQEHPFACEFCKDFVSGSFGDFYEQPTPPECNGSNPSCGFLKGFPFPNGCRYHSKRREKRSETER